MQRRVVVFADDLNGKQADETLSFGLDGRIYEIDLTAANAEKLRKQLAKYVSAGRRLSTRRPRATGAVPTQRNVAAEDAGAIRAWAVANGYEVGNRGRIPAEIRAAYLAG